MENVFEQEICSVCKKNNTNDCSKRIIKEIHNNFDRVFCSEYQKDESKIEPYVPPLIITAKRDYVDFYER